MYKIIIYELKIFKIKQTNRIITKRYFLKLKTIHDIAFKDLTRQELEIKKGIYKDSKYITSAIKENENDWYFDNLNKKSEKAYKEYILKGGF